LAAIRHDLRVFTIGFTKKSAQEFFGAIRASGAKRVVDVRLHNTSQLAGFAKRDDLRYFLQELCQAGYVELQDLAPTQELLGAYRKHIGGWQSYERSFLQLMAQRHIEESVPRELISDSCLLCSEDEPEHCHRRLVAEYLRDRWGDLEIVHLT
jgi:uncharacterized protein (DUF488 family)